MWGRPGFHPWVGKMPWRRQWLSIPVFLPGKSHQQGNLGVYSLWGHKELATTEWLTHTHPDIYLTSVTQLWWGLTIFLSRFIFNWRIIALQYHVGFCHILTCISHRITHFPSLFTEHWFELPVSHRKSPLSVYFTYGNIHVSVLLSQFIPGFPSPAGSTTLFSMSVSPPLPSK